MSISSNVIQWPQKFLIKHLDRQHTCAIKKLTWHTFKLLQELDDPSLLYPALHMHKREDGHLQLTDLKEELEFKCSS
jgi:hypothetical protein